MIGGVLCLLCYFLLQMIFPCLETVAGSVEQGGDLSVPDFGRKHEEHQAVAVVEIIGGGVKVQELPQFLRREQLGSQPADLLLVPVQLFVQIVCDFRIRTSQPGGQLDELKKKEVGITPTSQDKHRFKESKLSSCLQQI